WQATGHADPSLAARDDEVVVPSAARDLQFRHARPSTGPAMRDLWQDIRFAIRTLRKTPTFSFLAIITIGLGVGANTAAFSMVHGVLLRRLPYAGDARLVHVMQPSATRPDASFSVPEIKDYRAQMKSFAAVAEYH